LFHRENTAYLIKHKSVNSVQRINHFYSRKSCMKHVIH